MADDSNRVWKTSKGETTYWTTTEPKPAAFITTQKKLADLRDMGGRG